MTLLHLDHVQLAMPAGGEAAAVELYARLRRSAVNGHPMVTRDEAMC